MNWKRESLALIFGMLVMLIIFGDGVHVRSPGAPQSIGNLDTIFGITYWPLMDVIYPLASIATFLLYGKVKGGMQFNATTTTLFVFLLIGLAIMQFDDIFVVIRHPITLPDTYWAVARWLYLFISTGSFLTFGWICEKGNPKTRF